MSGYLSTKLLILLLAFATLSQAGSYVPKQPTIEYCCNTFRKYYKIVNLYQPIPCGYRQVTKKEAIANRDMIVECVDAGRSMALLEGGRIDGRNFEGRISDSYGPGCTEKLLIK